MRIAMVGPFGFHPNKTMRSRALPLARALVARGHAVTLFMPPWQEPDTAGRQWQEDGVDIRYVPLSGGPPATARRLIRETLAWQPDVVHTFKPKAYSGLVAWWLWTFRRGAAALVTDSDDWEGRGGWNERAPYPWWQKRLFARQEGWGLSHHHALTVASRALESLAWAAGSDPARVFYLPNGPGIRYPAGYHTQKAGEKRAALGLEGRPVVLLYSRLFEFDTTRLTAVLSRTAEAVPDLAILSVGRGLYEDERSALDRQWITSGLDRRLVDAGWVDEAALPALLGAADVGLYLMDDNLLNRAKCPAKLADMATAGLPVVGEAVGQVPEYVRHGETGLLCPSGDVPGLAGALACLLQDAARRQAMGVASADYAKRRFSWANLAQRAETAYSVALRRA
jgi:glycosyltransferase involved in cell wall biosynthesis